MGRLQSALPQLAPVLGKMQWGCAAAGLAATDGWDLWGWSKNTFLYIRPHTLRVTANAYAIVCRRSDVQRVIHEFTALYQSKVAEYRAVHRYPMNGPVEIRVTGLDHPDDVGVVGPQPVLLSATRPRPDHPEWDCAVWLDILTVPGTPYANRFYREVEKWCLANFTADYASVRVEWSKGWGYTDEAAWTDPAVLGVSVPRHSATASRPGIGSAMPARSSTGLTHTASMRARCSTGCSIARGLTNSGTSEVVTQAGSGNVAANVGVGCSAGDRECDGRGSVSPSPPRSPGPLRGPVRPSRRVPCPACRPDPHRPSSAPRCRSRPCRGHPCPRRPSAPCRPTTRCP